MLRLIITLSALMLWSIGLTQNFDKLVFELNPHKHTQSKFFIDYSAKQISLWTSQHKDRSIWGNKQSVKITDDFLKEISFAIDCVDFKQFKDTSEFGRDGCWYRLTLLEKNNTLLYSSIWNGFKVEEHEELFRILLTKFHGKFNVPEIKGYLEYMNEGTRTKNSG